MISNWSRFYNSKVFIFKRSRNLFWNSIDFLLTYSKFNVKFSKNFLNLRRIFFSEFRNVECKFENFPLYSANRNSKILPIFIFAEILVKFWMNFVNVLNKLPKNFQNYFGGISHILREKFLEFRMLRNCWKVMFYVRKFNFSKYL